MRCLTRNASTPYKPMAASTTAVAANTPNNVSANRRVAIADPTSWVIGAIVGAGSRRSCVVSTTRSPSGVPSRRVRATTVIDCCGDACHEKYIIGRVPSVSRLWYRASATTPTIVINGPFTTSPTRICRPIGSSFGQYFRAIVALMITTAGAPSRSSAEMSRPRSSRIPIARK